jgi:hypothetical protein
MDEKEIQATMARLGEAVARYIPGHAPMPAGTAQDMFKLGADVLVKFTRLVDAIEVIASCQIDVTDAMLDVDASLETARPEGTC